MKNTTTDIYQVNDSFFHKIFDNPENARDFLERVLPAGLKNQLDLANIEIEDTKYVSNQFKKGFSDIVVKTSLKKKKGKKKLVDIYFIIEHKTEGRVEIFVQVLKYMVFEWEKDYNNNKPPRVIIPVVFYHGVDQWKVPLSFAGQFDVDEEVKQFLLDYRYVLFDTNCWDFRDESNIELKENVFLFTAMVLMKAAYKNDTAAILQIFNFWHERGFIDNTDIVLFFLAYISHTHEISGDKLKKLLDESKIDGGEIMRTLAQQMKEEFKEELKEELKEEFMQTLGPRLKDEGKKETAKELIKRGVDMDIIEEATGLSREELEKLASIVQ
jgi:predicted transposase/invertase (TIGR01784 family)